MSNTIYCKTIIGGNGEPSIHFSADPLTEDERQEKEKRHPTCPYIVEFAAFETDPTGDICTATIKTSRKVRSNFQ
jgi:hypothetical protein